MKKTLLSVVLVCCLVLSCVSSFAATAPTKNFVLDFEKPELITWKTICFKDDFKDKISIAPQAGFKGKAYKVSILEPEPGNTWWVTGMAIDPKASKNTDFKNLKKITFKYSSTVAFPGPKNDQFIIQVTWKSADGKKVIADIVDYPFVVKKGTATFTINVSKAITDKLNKAGADCHLNWIMIGLKDKASADVFRPGTFIVDDFTFVKG